MPHLAPVTRRPASRPCNSNACTATGRQKRLTRNRCAIPLSSRAPQQIIDADHRRGSVKRRSTSTRAASCSCGRQLAPWKAQPSIASLKRPAATPPCRTSPCRTVVLAARCPPAARRPCRHTSPLPQFGWEQSPILARPRRGLRANHSRVAAHCDSAALSAGLPAVIIPYSIRPFLNERCITSKHHASRTTFHHKYGRMTTGHGSQTPTHTE